jgi:hypothetical protein
LAKVVRRLIQICGGILQRNRVFGKLLSDPLFQPPAVALSQRAIASLIGYEGLSRLRLALGIRGDTISHMIVYFNSCVSTVLSWYPRRTIRLRTGTAQVEMEMLQSCGLLSSEETKLKRRRREERLARRNKACT